MAVQVGVIGAGLMGSTHVRTLSASVPDAEVAAVSDAIRGSAERIAREAGVQTVYTDALGLIHDPGIDAVVIASPANTHEQFVLACFEAGKPVLCEKPLASSAAEALRVVQAEVALKRRLIQVGYMRQFDPGYQEIQRIKDEGGVSAIVLNAAYGYHVQAELVGRSGTVGLAPPSLTLRNRDRAGGLSYPENWVPRFADAYRRQLADWIGAVKTGAPVGASAWDGYVASAIAEQIAAALAEAREATLKYAPRPPLYG